MASLADDISALRIGKWHQYRKGKEAKFGREAVNFAQRYTPENTAWYTRLAMERFMWESLRRMADPQAETSFCRVLHNARKSYGQEYW